VADDRSNPWGKARPKSSDASSSRPSDRSKPAPKSRRPDAPRDRSQDRRDSKPERPESARPQRERPAGDRASSARPGKPVTAERRPAKPRPPRPEPRQEIDELEERIPHPAAAERQNEYRIYGVNACLAAFQKRRDDIIRGYFSQDIAGKFGETMRYLAQQKKAYRVIDDEELAKVTQSTHHGGVCLLMKKRPATPVAELLERLKDRPTVCLLVLEGVGNPHNLGAILRSCAHFDVPAVLVENANLLQSGAAARVAEGGAEWVEPVEYGSMTELLEQLQQAGFSLLSTSSHQGRDLYRTELPARTAIVFGEESQGVTTDTLKSSELCVRIPGSSQVESLNVSLAAGIILGEYWRQHRSGSRAARTMSPAQAQPKGGRLKLKSKARPAKP